MKTFKVISVLLSLMFSIIVGNIAAQYSDTGLMVAGVDILPLAIASLLFGGSLIPFAPFGSLCAYVAVNVAKPGTNAGRGSRMHYEIIFINLDAVDNFPECDDKGVVRTGDITFKADSHMITVYSTPGTIINSSSIDGEIDNKGFIQSCKFNHPGSEKEIREFKTNWSNANIAIIVKKCDNTSMDLYGEPCNPLQMVTANWTEDSSKNVNEFEFKSIGRGRDVSIYTGSVDFGGSGESSSGA